MEHVLHNVMEELVLHKLDDILKTVDCCKCDRCRLDIASYALNRLPPKYVITSQGELLSKLNFTDLQSDAQLTTAIIEGAMIVAKSPRHEG